MKHLLVLTLLFTLTFPAYCFASPTNNKALIDENIAIEIMWILEDGVVDSEEMDNIISIYQIDETCEYGISLFLSGLYGALAGITFGGSWNPTGTYLMMFLLVNAHVLCNVLGEKDILIPIPLSPES